MERVEIVPWKVWRTNEMANPMKTYTVQIPCADNGWMITCNGTTLIAKEDEDLGGIINAALAAGRLTEDTQWRLSTSAGQSGMSARTIIPTSVSVSGTQESLTDAYEYMKNQYAKSWIK
jgi:hypothetical protein